MSDDSLGTIWKANPHTLAKLSILRSYLQAWMPILSNRAANQERSEVVYVDAFAGPGQYEGGEDGSPLVAIRAATMHQHDFPRSIRLFFVEKDLPRVRHLEGVIKKIGSRRRNAVIEPPIHGSAHEEVPKILDSGKDVYRPTLVFLDQFGYSAVPIELIQRILQEPSSEIFSFMNWRDLDRYLKDQTKWPGIARAFGGEEWKAIIDLQGIRRSNRFLELYDLALRDRAGAQYSCSFSMHDSAGRLLYWLIFCSNSDRGLEEMKRAMWKVDETGSFQFSDKHAGQLSFLEGFDSEWLSETLHKRLLGEEMSIQEIRHFVLTETPCHTFKKALARLESDGRLRVLNAPSGRRKGSFKDGDTDSLVLFEKNQSQLGLFSAIPSD